MRPEAWASRAGRGRRWLGVCLGVLALLVGPYAASLAWAQQTQLVDGIAAIVNDEIITITEVREAMGFEAEQMAQQLQRSGP